MIKFDKGSEYYGEAIEQGNWERLERNIVSLSVVQISNELRYLYKRTGMILQQKYLVRAIFDIPVQFSWGKVMCDSQWIWLDVPTFIEE